jgi:hypothetical protein
VPGESVFVCLGIHRSLVPPLALLSSVVWRCSAQQASPSWSCRPLRVLLTPCHPLCAHLDQPSASLMPLSLLLALGARLQGCQVVVLKMDGCDWLQCRMCKVNPCGFCALAPACLRLGPLLASAVALTYALCGVCRRSSVGRRSVRDGGPKGEVG